MNKKIKTAKEFDEALEEQDTLEEVLEAVEAESSSNFPNRDNPQKEADLGEDNGSETG